MKPDIQKLTASISWNCSGYIIAPNMQVSLPYILKIMVGNPNCEIQDYPFNSA